jgi:hypothetical protein
MSETVRLNSVQDVLTRVPLSRSKLYQEMASGRLKSVRVGRRRLVAECQLIDYIDNLIEAGTPDEECHVTAAAVVDADVAEPVTTVVRP